MQEYLEFKNISKSFPGVRALNDISIRAEAGRVLALMGENGAGKSTLLKILSGDLHPDEGEIIISGEVTHFMSPHDSIRGGVSVIYQERQMIPALSVMENIFAGDLPKNKMGFIDRKQLKKEARAIIEKFGLDIDPEIQVGRISVAYQQMVEIMKAYRRNSRIICFDEPTASLADSEISILFKLIEELKKNGTIIIYVSHRMSEIFRITDDIVVLKDGNKVGTFETDKITEAELIKAMVGRDISDTYSKLSRNTSIGEVLLEVKNLRNNKIDDVSFKVRAGEIVGFSGLVGAGRTEVARAIFGADKLESGEVILNGKKVHFKSPAEAIDAGIALCPEDRKEEGLILQRSILDNVSMPVLGKIRNGLFINSKTERTLSDEAVDRYAIKTPSISKKVVELSGGNQQKVILGRWTSSKMTTKVLILDEPTKGIDVGTKAEIYQTVCDFAKQGIGVIFISSELTEVIGVADRIYVMHDGMITGCLPREEATEESVLALAMSNERYQESPEN